jgi:hypothetical protein
MPSHMLLLELLGYLPKVGYLTSSKSCLFSHTLHARVCERESLFLKRTNERKMERETLYWIEVEDILKQEYRRIRRKAQVTSLVFIFIF